MVSVGFVVVVCCLTGVLIHLRDGESSWWIVLFFLFDPDVIDALSIISNVSYTLILYSHSPELQV